MKQAEKHMRLSHCAFIKNEKKVTHKWHSVTVYSIRTVHMMYRNLIYALRTSLHNTTSTNFFCTQGINCRPQQWVKASEGIVCHSDIYLSVHISQCVQYKLTLWFTSLPGDRTVIESWSANQCQPYHKSPRCISSQMIVWQSNKHISKY
jgi:hypothetical protein